MRKLLIVLACMFWLLIGIAAGVWYEAGKAMNAWTQQHGDTL